MGIQNLPNGTLYLSGGMQFKTDLGAGWRADCTKRLNQLNYSSIDIADLDIAYTASYGELYRNFVDSKDLTIRKANIRRHYIHADLELVTKHSQAMIVLYDESVRLGAGTHGEIQEAYTNHIPIFLVNGYPQLDEVPGWMQATTARIFASFDELYEYLAALPKGILIPDQYGNRRETNGNAYMCSLCGTPFRKKKHVFVSQVSPLYCQDCVDVTAQAATQYPDRYEFFKQQLEGK